MDPREAKIKYSLRFTRARASCDGVSGARALCDATEGTRVTGVGMVAGVSDVENCPNQNNLNTTVPATSTASQHVNVTQPTSNPHITTPTKRAYQTGVGFNSPPSQVPEFPNFDQKSNQPSRHDKDDLKFKPWPRMGSWLTWKEDAEFKIRKCTGFPELIQKIVNGIEAAKSVHDLPDESPFPNLNILIHYFRHRVPRLC